MQRTFERQRFAVDIEGKPRHRFVEQPVPRRMAGHALLVKQRFKLIGKLKRSHRPEVAQPRPVMRKRGRRERLLQCRVFQPVEFKREKQQSGRDRRHALLHVAIKLCMNRTGVVLRVEKPGK